MTLSPLSWLPRQPELTAMESYSWLPTARDFGSWLASTGKSQETQRTYVTSTRILFAWALERELIPEQLDQTDMESFIKDQRALVSDATARNRLLAARAFFGYVIAREKRTDNPTAGLIVKKPKTLPKQPCSIQDLRRLTYGAHSPRDYAMILMLASTGIRIGELVKMKIEQIDWDAGQVLIDGKGNKQRLVAPGAEAMDALRKVADRRRRGFLWLTKDGNPMRRDGARKNFYQLTQRLGISAHPHKLRATFANMFLQEGGDLGALQSAMGHSDISTTAHYAAATRQERGLRFMQQMNIAGRIL